MKYQQYVLVSKEIMLMTYVCPEFSNKLGKRVQFLTDGLAFLFLFNKTAKVLQFFLVFYIHFDLTGWFIIAPSAIYAV